jgi:hypothetical protein
MMHLTTKQLNLSIKWCIYTVDFSCHFTPSISESTPCEDELTALRQGRDWDPVAAAKEKEDRLQRQKEDEEHESKSKKEKFVPKSNYKVTYPRRP